MTFRISHNLPVFNFERLDMWSAWIGHPREKLLTFEFLKSFHCSISSVSIYSVLESDLRVNSNDRLNFSRAFVDESRASRHILRRNRTSVWKCMSIWNSRELPLFNFERLDMWCAWIGDPSEKLWPSEFLESFRYSILSILIYYVPEPDIRVKRYDDLNLSRASIIQFRASRYIMWLNRTSVWKVMSIWISRELPLFNFERLNILCAWFRPMCEKLWPF